MYIVTGGAGFIGSCLAAELVRQGKTVAIVDSLGVDDQWVNVRKDLFETFIHPSRAGEFAAALGDKVEGVFHLGANSSTTAADGDQIREVNIDASKFWWNFCRERAIPLIYASSAATYGDGSNGFVDDDSPEALARLRPLNLYGWSKHYFDRWAVNEALAGRSPPVWAGLKFFNVYGPNEQHKGDMKSVVAKNYAVVRDNGVVSLFRSHRPDYVDGGQLRDFVYVKDCVQIALWLGQGRAAGGLYNVGSGKARSFADLIGAVGQALSVEPKIAYIDMPESIRDKYQYFTEADMSKLRRAGYDRQLHELERGVADYVLNHLVAGESY